MTVMRLSVSLSQSKDARDHTQFTNLSTDKLSDIAKISISQVWSPCIWNNGYRQMRRFIGCDIGVLDFDSGRPTILDVMKSLDVQYVLITTKSHQREKKSASRVIPPCDRYRLIFPLVNQMNIEPARYKWQMVWLHRKYPGADRSCIDPARFYWPGVEIVNVCDTGKILNLPQSPSEKQLQENLQKAINYERAQIDSGIIPPWLASFLEYGVGVGKRRPMIFKSAATLARFGFSLGEVISFINKSPFDRSGIDEHEFRRHVVNGYNYGKK
jgi:hypothetical protein